MPRQFGSNTLAYRFRWLSSSCTFLRKTKATSPETPHSQNPCRVPCKCHRISLIAELRRDHRIGWSGRPPHLSRTHIRGTPLPTIPEGVELTHTHVHTSTRLLRAKSTNLERRP